MKSTLKAVALVFAGAILALAGAHTLGWTGKTVVIEDPINASGHHVRNTSQASAPLAAPANFVEAAEQTVKAVVHVKTKSSRTSQRYNPFEDLFFGRPSAPREYEVQGSGSGVLISREGYIVTNNHVIEGATEITVTTAENNEFTAQLIGTDPTTDIALLKISAVDLPPVQVANSDEVRLGEWVLAVGNPFNLTSTVTAGIISAKGRDINIIDEQSAIESFIQTDAAVNPGNSGGALVNTRGELVGINTAISSRSGSFEGYSFAVPSNLVMKVVADLKEFGKVQRAFIGINYNEITPTIAAELELNVNAGIYVAGVVSNGAAAEAGIEPGDVIVNLDGKPILTGADLTEAVGRKRPGEQINLVVNRKGKNRVFNVVLKNQLGTTELMTKEEEVLASYGATLKDLSVSDMRKYGIRRGVVVDEVLGGRFERAGIPDGFIIIKLNNVFVENVESFERLIRQFNPGDGVLIQGIEPNGNGNYYAFEW